MGQPRDGDEIDVVSEGRNLAPANNSTQIRGHIHRIFNHRDIYSIYRIFNQNRNENLLACWIEASSNHGSIDNQQERLFQSCVHDEHALVHVGPINILVTLVNSHGFVDRTWPCLPPPKPDFTKDARCI